MKRSSAAHSDHDSHASHHGLAEDLKVLTRRRLFGMVAKAAAGLSLAPALVGCVTDNAAGDGVDAGTGGDSTTGTATCSTIPNETQGPYPGDGTNGANALTLSGIVRSDIRASVGGATGVAQGVVLDVTLTLLDSKTCSPLADRAIYIWHCDRESKYSMYNKPEANYLRGVQATDAKGRATFTTIFPGCYPGRWPHIHFEVYPSLKSITDAKKVAITSQLAFPEKTCAEVYAEAGYEASAKNLENVSLATDGSFSDDEAAHQMATVTGNVKKGYQATLKIAV